MRRARVPLYIMPAVLLFMAANASASALRDQLEQQTDYVPSSMSVSKQLIEVARYFHIPMAIEWLQDSNEPAPIQISSEKRSVRELIKAIVKQSARHQVVVQDRIVYVFPPAAVSSQMNFLNLRPAGFEVKNESLFAANFQLQICIDEKLYPEQFESGFFGGYGGPPGDLFWRKNITVSGDNLTIREILNEIAIESHSALWMVELSPDELKGDKPKWVGVPINEHGTSPLTGRWRFIPIVPDEVNASNSN